MTKEQFRTYITGFDFSSLFREQGWDNFDFETEIILQNNTYIVKGVVQKRDFPILQCVCNTNNIVEHSIRKQITAIIGKSYFLNHLLIFINSDKTWQYWQLPIREDGKLRQLILTTWHEGQDPEILYQKYRNLVFNLDEEETITLVDVMERVSTLSVNSERVTKQFYAEFVLEHTAFLAFIKGLDDAIPNRDNAQKHWYASLMLNRLMFCYFIQKKGFLDGNVNYLRVKLAACKNLLGKNNFFGFYRSFLLELFHNELGKPVDKRPKGEHPVPFGAIPYLNGGIFDVHELESKYTGIAIEDAAFEKLFAFFDKWEWHLDNRMTASGKDINPDVIGYIFEKYINQKEMGAYYTKEDITDYISKNTIIPFLLEKVKSFHPAPFEAGGAFWQYLQDSEDEYIYDSVKKGAEGAATLDELAIPANIRSGIDTAKPDLLERRKDWNRATPEEIGLPTEIWRETIARLQRYFELKAIIKKGQIQEINDLITYNLDIRRLIQEYLEQTQDAKFIREFYKALCGITILDPTCGSGAFLFAALTILEPLYEVCISRMEAFYEANPRGNTDFRQRLDLFGNTQGSTIQYTIYKTIILNNLYGVDIMKEAVEIAKLRLFLKLVAEVDPSRRKPNYGLEPLPDIDFNIRAGNTLVGFVTEQHLEEVVKNCEGPLLYKEKYGELKNLCEGIAGIYRIFQLEQLKNSSNSAEYKKLKLELSEKLKELSERFNNHFADIYGLGTHTQRKSAEEKDIAYQEWKESHQPFHWLSEFYGIITKGGFDVVIGNPPYVEYSKVRSTYTIKGYETESCGNLYAFVIERSLKLMYRNSRFGMIVPVSLGSTPRMKSVRESIKISNRSIFYSNYADRPTGLFLDVHQILSIILLTEEKIHKLLSSAFYHWYNDERLTLFNKINYIESTDCVRETLWGKYGKIEMLNIYLKVQNKKTRLIEYFQRTGKLVSISGGTGGYWLRAFDFMQISSEYKNKYVENEIFQKCICGLLNSSLFYQIWRIYSDCRHLTDSVKDKVFLDIDDILSKKLIKISEEYLNALKGTVELRQGVLTYEQYRPSKVKEKIDEIDKILANHYGFTEEELDFIINYDIKYRMGSELEGEE